LSSKNPRGDSISSSQDGPREISTERKSFVQAQEAAIGKKEKGIYFENIATISAIR
jgi:hypothetical protein